MTKKVVLPENLNQAMVIVKQQIPKVTGLASEGFVTDAVGEVLTAMNALAFVKDVTFDTDTGILTLTRRDNSVVSANLAGGIGALQKRVPSVG